MFLSIESKHPKFYQVFRVFIVFFASILYAWNLRCFAKTAGLFPGGFAGVSLLLQKIGLTFFHIDIPYTFFNVVLNIFPIYIGFRFLGKKFTWYSILTIFLSSIFVDLLPAYVFTQDVLLISVFGWSFKRICHLPVLKRWNYYRWNRFYQYLSFLPEGN